MRRKDRAYLIFVVLLVAGLLLANLLLVVLSLLPLVMIALFSYAIPPGRVRVEGEESGSSLSTGDVARISRHATVEGGPGLAVMYDPLPANSKLVEGRNIKVLWKEAGPADVEMDYAVKMARRGRYSFGPTAVAISGVEEDGGFRTTTGSDRHDVIVRDPSGDLKKMSNIGMLPRLPLPVDRSGLMGALTTDFKEIREYSRGDRYKNINWKATSRASGAAPWPMVNTYEIEERRSVLVLLDNGPDMAAGTADATLFEYATQAAMGVSQMYMARGFDVGLMAYGTGATIVPGTGHRQDFIISRLLLDIEATNSRGSVGDAVRAFPRQLRSGPLVVIITSLRHDNRRSLETGIRKLMGSMGPKGTIMLIDVASPSAEQPGEVGELAGRLVELGAPVESVDLGALGVGHHSWNPREGSFIDFVTREFGVGA